MDAGLGHALHSGPVDHSVLTLQEHHRSTDIWAGRDFEPLTCRRCDGHFWRLGSLDPRVQQMLLKAGFYGVYKAGRIRLDHALITALVERWRPETHTFHLSVGEATVTLQDIAVLWGLPVDGPPITGVDTNRSMDEWQHICNELLGFRPPPEDFDRGRLKIRCLQERFKILPDNASEETVKYYARAYILQLLGGQLLSDMSNNKVKLMYLPLLRDFEQSGRLSWGSAVLACLYRALCRASKPETSDICGPLVLLQIWAWERLPFVRPGRLSPQPQPQPDFIDDDHPLPASPWGSRWNVGFKLESVGTHILVLYRDQLDNMKDEQFIWEPYPADVLASLPEYCLSGRRIWQTVSPLICFDVVEFHHPDRAFRQFGQQQTVPSPCDTIPDIHLTDRRGRQNYDWAHHHRQFVDMWEDRYGRVISTPPIEHPMDQNDPYMLWYRRITRSLIGNPAKRPNTGYRGVGAMEEMAQSLQKIYHRAADAINQGCEVSGQDVLKEIQEICAFSLRAAHEDHRLTLNAGMNLPSPSASTLLPPTRVQRGRPGKRGALGGSQSSGGRRRASYVPTLLQTNSLEVSHSPMPSGTPLSIGEMSDTPQTWDSSMSAHDFQDIATSSSMQLDPEAADTKKPILQALGKIQDICSFALRMSNGDQSMPVKQELSPTAPKTKRCKPRRRGGMTAYPVGTTSSEPYFQYTSEPSTPTPSASVGPIESHSQLHNVVEHEVGPLVAQMARDSPLTEIENLQSEMIELDTITGSREPSPSYANHPSILDLPCDPSGHQNTVMLSAEVETNFLIDDNAHMITESEVMAQPVNDEDNPTDAEVLQQTLDSTVAELHVKSPEQEDSDSPIVKCNKASDPRDLLVASNLTAPEHEVSTSHPNPDEVVTELDKPEAEHEVVASDPNSDAVVSEVNEPDSTLEAQSVNSPKQAELQNPENRDSKISFSRNQPEHSSPKHNNLNPPSPKQVNTTISESSVHVVSDEASLPEVVEIDTDSVSAGGGKRKGLVLERASSGESTQALVKSEETSDVAKNDQNAVKEDGQRRYYKRQRRSASRNRS